MAMKVKPGIALRGNALDNTLYSPAKLSSDVKTAIEAIQPAPSLWLSELESTRKRPKQHPRQKVARRKPEAKAKPVKVKQSQKKPTIPVAVDEERYALWWDFKKDRTFMSVPYPIQPKDRAEGIRKSLNAQKQRAAQKRLRETGTKLRCDKPDPSKIGTVCHEASPAFKTVVDSNMDYVRELSARTCVDTSIASAIMSLRDRHRTPTELPVETQSIDNSFAISVLEQQLAQPVKSITTRHERAEDKYWKDKLDDLGLSFNPSANDSQFDAIETRNEKDQWMTPEERFSEIRESIKHEPWYNNSEVQYYLALQAMDEPWYESTEVFNLSIITDVHVIDGIEYGEFLRTRCGPQGREAVEQARKSVSPMYEMDIGTQVHPLEQTDLAAFHKLVSSLQTNRLAMHHYGILNSLQFNQWSKLQSHHQSLPLIDVDTIEHLTNQKNKEALAEKLVAKARNQHSFKHWVEHVESLHVVPVLTNVVEETTQRKLTTIDSEVNPITDGKVTEVVDNVFNLQTAKLKRNQGMQKLLSGMFNFKDFSVEEKAGAKKFIAQLYEAIG